MQSETAAQPSWRQGPWADSIRLAAVAGLALLLAGAAVWAIDWPAARGGVHARLDTRDLRSLCKVVCLADLFSDGLGVAAILLLAATLDSRRRGAIARIAALALVVGSLSDGVNAALGWAQVCPVDHRLFWLATFAGQLPAHIADRAHGFLSPHVAVATALALGLAKPYRQGRTLFGVFAALAIAERLLFFQDSLPGALVSVALGCVACAACASPSALGAVCDLHQQRRQDRMRSEKPNDASRRNRRAAAIQLLRSAPRANTLPIQKANAVDMARKWRPIQSGLKRY